MKKLSLILCFVWLLGCQNQDQLSNTESNPVSAEPQQSLVGLWRGVLQSPGGELPFGIQMILTDNGYTAKILNGQERADTSGVSLHGNELEIQFKWYDAKLTATVNTAGDEMHGQWSKTEAEQVTTLPFSATKGLAFRFKPKAEFLQETDVAGIWQAEFKAIEGPFVAVGEFQQTDHQVYGTFLTPMGDYRYLTGQAAGGALQLSTFDGGQAWLFSAVIDASGQLVGEFWSGDSYHVAWQAKRNDEAYAALPNSWTALQVNPTDKVIEFEFENLRGAKVQLSDENFKGQPVMINLFSSWCAQCNDAASVWVDLYQQYHTDGLQVVGLALDGRDETRAKKQLRLFKKRHGIQFPLLITGADGINTTAELLGIEQQTLANPTHVFLDRKHQIVSIQSGFAGPATGRHFNALVQELNHQIKAIVY